MFGFDYTPKHISLRRQNVLGLNAIVLSETVDVVIALGMFVVVDSVDEVIVGGFDTTVNKKWEMCSAKIFITNTRP